MHVFSTVRCFHKNSYPPILIVAPVEHIVNHVVANKCRHWIKLRWVNWRGQVKCDFRDIDLAPSHILQINGQGRATSSAWATTSDIRLKDLYGEFQYGLKEILSLDTVWFRYKKDNSLGLPSEEIHAGVVAQQVQSVIPEAVERGKDGYLILNADPIYWATINAVKELAAQHQEDQRQIETLRNQQDKLLRYICSKDKNASFCR